MLYKLLIFEEKFNSYEHGERAAKTDPVIPLGKDICQSCKGGGFYTIMLTITLLVGLIFLTCALLLNDKPTLQKFI